MIDIILDTLIDSLKLLPFLFIAFLIIELIEHKLNKQTKTEMGNKEKDLEKIMAENQQLRAEHIQNAVVLKKFKSVARIISHDLRSPIASSVGCLELCLEMIKEENIVNKNMTMFLSMAAEQNRNLLVLVDNLLVWSRMQIDGVKIVNEKINLKNILADTISPYMLSCLSKGINIRFDVEDVSVVVNKSIFQFIIRNLFINAVKFTPKNGEINLFAKKQDDFVSVVVKDNGIGMTQEKIKKIFESIGETSLGTEGEKGTGLGLAMCNEMAEKAGILISVDSEGEGKGSSFTISIPKQKK